MGHSAKITRYAQDMPHSDSTASTLDAEALARLRELDPSGANGLLDRVINAYMNSLDRLIPELMAARGANLQLNAILQVAHTLKSSSASLGALKLSKLCADVEMLARTGDAEHIEAEIDAMLAELGRARVALAALRTAQP
jgi:hypothetical protein